MRQTKITWSPKARWSGIFLILLTVLTFSGIPSAQAAMSTTAGKHKLEEKELHKLFDESLDFLLNVSDTVEKKGQTVLITLAPLESEILGQEISPVSGLPDFLQKYLPSPRRLLEEAQAAQHPEQTKVTYSIREQQTGGSSSPNRGFSPKLNPGASLFKMVPPLQTLVISSRFGWRHNRPHQGTDFAAPMGADIRAVESGKITYAGWNGGGYGNLVTIDHGNSMKSRYAHCSKILVRTAQTVEKGQVIAKVGSTGRSTGPHLHFEVLVNNTHQNPEHYLFR